MNERTLKNMIIAVAALLAALLIVAVIVIAVSGDGDTAVQAGISYLESLEAREPTLAPGNPTQPTELSSQADSDPSESTEPTEPTETENPDGLTVSQRLLIESIKNEEVDIWSLFHDYVILGDSRAVGFWYFGFLPEEHCLTGGGNTIRNVATNMDGIMERNPKYIFLCYGLNDVSIGFWPTPESYAEEMVEIILDLQLRLPEATIIVSSILPARDPAFERSSKWYKIPDYSAAVGEACDDVGAIFVDNDAICEEYAKWWQPDGIHVRPEFYPYWAQNLILGIIEGGAYE